MSEIFCLIEWEIECNRMNYYLPFYQPYFYRNVYFKNILIGKKATVAL